MNSHLRREVRDLALVACGAIPGALLRWQLEQLAQASGGGLRAITAADLLANLIGCLLIGMLLAQPPRRARLYLWGGDRLLRLAHHLLQLDAGAGEGARCGQAAGGAGRAGREPAGRPGSGAGGCSLGQPAVALSPQGPPAWLRINCRLVFSGAMRRPRPRAGTSIERRPSPHLGSCRDGQGGHQRESKQEAGSTHASAITP